MSIDIFALVAAFGGGVFGASVGALPAFILTGVVAIIGGIASVFGTVVDGNLVVAADYVTNMAFGSFLGPHVAFAGGVAAAAYAKKIGASENGADIATSCNGYGNPSILAVGGVFGIIGYIIAAIVLFIFGTVLPIGTDNPGMTVFISGCIARLAFGKRGLLSDANVRAPLSKGGALGNMLLISIGYAIVVSGVYVVLAGTVKDVAVLSNYHVVIFGLAAVSLVFAEMGQPLYGWHHIGIISAEGAMAGYAIGGAGMAMILGIVMGLVAGILQDFETCFMNSDVDSHIDGPAFAIFISTIIISIIKLVA